MSQHQTLTSVCVKRQIYHLVNTVEHTSILINAKFWACSPARVSC